MDTPRRNNATTSARAGPASRPGPRGGFIRADIDESLESNRLGWSVSMAPVAGELEAAFRRTDPAIARMFARTTFLSGNRADVTVPTAVPRCSSGATGLSRGQCPTAITEFASAR